MLGSLHHLGSPPLESNSNPLLDSGTRPNASPNGEQTLPVMSCENAPIPRSLGPTSGEPHCGRSMNQSSRVPNTTSETLGQSLSGTSRPLNTTSGVPSQPSQPSGQGASAPDIPILSETRIESPAHSRGEGINQATGETFLEEVDPGRGPTTGGIRIALFGENFPAVPLYVGFGDNWVRAVSYAQRHYSF